ncbi:MAG TPA: DNA mismatch repair endonuclease MutL [Patescibacteria group bacterium]|nr:DNA mismatch repair endonuclease MutL [Patescibacteria group bacterium]
MSVIRTLPPEVSSRIAAGEVIERPLSVVKELLDNALDAHASRIVIDIGEGGKSYIRVEDDGDGITAVDLPVAVENFSTSKIRRSEDLANVQTLGFRGEALASIRTVSTLTIASRFREEDIGRQMQWRGNACIKDEPCVRNPGTEIGVRDLFYDFPARRKFLAKDTAERRRIASLVQTFALAFPEVGFTLRDGESEIYAYAPSSLRERVEAILGNEIFPNLKTFDERFGRMSIHGFTSLPAFTRSNRSHQYHFVNRRSVHDRMISHAIRQAYESLIPGDRFPVVVLFLEVPPEEIDINVHPAKAEIRFRRQAEVHRFVSTALREVLRGNTISFQEKVESIYRNIFPSATPLRSDSAAARQSDYDQHVPTGGDTSLLGEENPTWNLHEAPLSLFEEGDASAVMPGGKLYWQLHQSFILIQIRGGLVIVDQHAAHERILFNAAKKNIQGESPAVQSLLFPATLELTAAEFERFEELSGMLPRIGFEAEPFGLRSIIIRGIPSGARNWNDGTLLRDILHERGGHGSGIEEVLKTYACRSAVKAGARLSTSEMEGLTDQLFATDFPFTCPHGRPTMLRVDLADLERRFQRTVSSAEK